MQLWILFYYCDYYTVRIQPNENKTLGYGSTAIFHCAPLQNLAGFLGVKWAINGTVITGHDNPGN